MMVSLVLCLLASVLAGLLIVSCCWPGLRPAYSQGLLKLCLATGLGLGLTSCSYWLWGAFLGPEHASLTITELLSFAALLALFALWRRSDRSLPLHEVSPATLLPLKWRRLLWGGFGLVLAGAVIGFALWSWRTPHGNWDAWNIWNMRARFLYREEAGWTSAFSPKQPRSHPDYPLLVPAAIARCWYYAGREDTVAPRVIAGLFTFATVGLLVGTVRLLRGHTQALLAGLVLLGTGSFVALGAAQYADVPLSFFFLAATVLFAVNDASAPDRLRLVFLAGLTTGLAAWTKNEGWLFLVVTVLTRVLLAVRSRTWAPIQSELPAFALGLLPALAAVVCFKIGWAPPNDLVAGQGGETTLARLVDPARHLKILAAYGKYVSGIGWGVVYLLVVYRFLIGRRTPSETRHGTAHPIFVLLLMIAGYYGVYLLTPQDLAFHLDSSLDRLLMQLWPTALLAFFLCMATPEEALQAPKPIAGG
jgi:hypothetical protein